MRSLESNRRALRPGWGAPHSREGAGASKSERSEGAMSSPPVCSLFTSHRSPFTVHRSRAAGALSCAGRGEKAILWGRQTE